MFTLVTFPTNSNEQLCWLNLSLKWGVMIYVYIYIYIYIIIIYNMQYIQVQIVLNKDAWLEDSARYNYKGICVLTCHYNYYVRMLNQELRA